MSELISFHSGDRNLEIFLMVGSTVALISGAAWLMARLWAHSAVMRHLVLLSALISCLTIPAAIGLCTAAGLTLVSIPVLHGPETEASAAATRVESDRNNAATEKRSTPLPMASEQLPLQDKLAPYQPASVATPSRDNQHRATSVTAVARPEIKARWSGSLVSIRGLGTMAIYVWAAGCLFLLVRFARNCQLVLQLRRSSRADHGERLETLFQQVLAQLRMRHIHLLLVSSRAVSPSAVGLGRPAIILPDSLPGAIDDDELRDILVHEMAHLVRGDQWVILWQELAAALYWPIVTVHALNRELQRTREELCDNVVLAGRDPLSYSETLLHVAGLLLTHNSPLKVAAGIVGRPGELERRVVGLIDPRRNLTTIASHRATFSVWLIFFAAGMLLATTRFAPAAASDAAAQESQSPTAAANLGDKQSAGYFNGRVTDSDGKPVHGARIFILPLSDSLDGETALRTGTEALAIRAQTAGDGHFEFYAPDMVLTDLDGLGTVRRCFVIASADGYGTDWREVRGAARSSTIRTPIKSTDLALQLVADDTPIRGRFLNPEGRPLAAARVELTQLIVPKQSKLNNYINYVTHPDSATMNGPEYERSLFRVLPLAGMTTQTQTDSEGRFVLSGLGRERVATLKVSSPGTVDTRITVVTRDIPDLPTLRFNGKPTQVTYGAKFTLQLQRGLTVKGQVRDRDTQQPIPGMWVGWNRDPLNGLLSGEYSRTTDADGRFTITGLDPQLFGWNQTFREIMAVSAPGIPYLPAFGEIKPDSEIVITCQRGIPFRLKVVDEQGGAVRAEVTYRELQPNPQLPVIPHLYDGRWPISQAADQGDGIYSGYVLPGPGAVFVRTPGRVDYRPAYVDPKAFFAPGRTNWTAQEKVTAYGNQDSLISSQAWINQHDYVAIVLINPPSDSPSLELSATLIKDRPRPVSLIDTDGKPVTGVKTEGLTFRPYDDEPPLRSASLRLTGLDPVRARRIAFFHEERHMIGELVARADGESPYTVVMQPWGTVTGQLVDENNKPINATISVRRGSPLETNTDSEIGEYSNIKVDGQGRFQIDRLVPGQRYTAEIYRGIGMFAGMGFENLIVRPGETRDLGHLRTKPPIDVSR